MEGARVAQADPEGRAQDPTAPEIWKRRYAPEEVPVESGAPSPKTRARKNNLDEMTIRRTEVPVQGARPRKPTLDEMGPGGDAGVPLSKPVPPKPRSIGGRAGSQAGRRGRR